MDFSLFGEIGFPLIEAFGFSIQVLLFLKDSFFQILKFSARLLALFLEFGFHLEETVLGLKNGLLFDRLCFFSCLIYNGFCLLLKLFGTFLKPVIANRHSNPDSEGYTQQQNECTPHMAHNLLILSDGH